MFTWAFAYMLVNGVNLPLWSVLLSLPMDLWALAVIFGRGHNMVLDSSDAAGPSTCKKCGHKEPGVEWPRSEEE